MPRRIVVAHYYLNGRERLAARGEYPRSHLWGINGLRERGYDIRLLSKPPRSLFLDWLTRSTRGAFGNIAEQIEMRREARTADALYIVTGFYPLIRLARARGRIRCPVCTWLYEPAAAGPQRRIHSFLPWLSREQGIDGYLCLTRAAEQYAARLVPPVFARYIPWGADAAMFQPQVPATEPYALACGRNGRDFTTLLEAAKEFVIPLKLLAPTSAIARDQLPARVQWLEGPPHSGTDEGLSYRELVPLQARAFCHIICLAGNKNTAAGLTNLLEAMAVGRPVIMTRTGCLDIDLEREGAGIYVTPGDPQALARAVSDLWRSPDRAAEMGRRGRLLIESRFNLKNLDRGVTAFFEEAIGAPCP
jgi:glycosyltransferase involved in cell wall biosynthesis